MRALFTSLFAFILSGFLGGVVAQQLAVATGATEEYIVVFMATALVAILVTAFFFVAQFRSDPVRAADRTMWRLLAIFGLALVVLAGWTFAEPAANGSTARDLSIIAGLILPGAATILVQWLFVRWRLKRAAIKFGRDGANA
ncbi:hypothetical protein FJ987_16895 [Mesorhizobium sp. CU2]|uniref:hypothetical protein n=1 Tax=unclassified Mesorhizobium TaxID=325217 RepID=UPI001127BFEF|nr:MULTISPECIES: hypothetical protein [unclassified Mesorhizobium]TPN86442.1 hypothetical protein FJ988_06545 [Mesorhizobium sp. CU3]TPO12556.1 hypothetical protein FJ987_16895 [Mesorhizobium sp. CU2]